MLHQGNLRAQRVSNVTLCLQYLDGTGMRRDNIGAVDVVDGKATPVLGLMCRIMNHFSDVSDVPAESGSGAPPLSPGAAAALSGAPSSEQSAAACES